MLRIHICLNLSLYTFASNQCHIKFCHSWSKNNLRKIVIIFLSISLNMCFGCSKELSHWDGSFEYPQHMFWLRNKKNNVQSGGLYTVLPFLEWFRSDANEFRQLNFNFVIHHHCCQFCILLSVLSCQKSLLVSIETYNIESCVKH